MKRKTISVNNISQNLKIKIFNAKIKKILRICVLCNPQNDELSDNVELIRQIISANDTLIISETYKYIQKNPAMVNSFLSGGENFVTDVLSGNIKINHQLLKKISNNGNKHRQRVIWQTMDIENRQKILKLSKEIYKIANAYM